MTGLHTHNIEQHDPRLWLLVTLHMKGVEMITKSRHIAVNIGVYIWTFDGINGGHRQQIKLNQVQFDARNFAMILISYFEN